MSEFASLDPRNLPAHWFPLRTNPQRPEAQKENHPVMIQASQHMSYGNPELRKQHEEEAQAALARQSVQYAIAPRHHVDVPRGRLEAGDEILLSDLALPGKTVPQLVMNELIKSGHVLKADEWRLRAAKCPPDAEFRVAEEKALTSKRGVLGPGEQITPDDVQGGRDQLLHLASKGLVVHRPKDGGPKAA